MSTAIELPSIKVGLLNVSWTNGSREKPLNPITPTLIADFEDKPNLKINWVNDFTGFLTLEGDFNYLIFNNYECYFMEKTKVIDIDKLIYVYTIIKDHWQTFISNPNNYVKGCLIKTNKPVIVWQYIQQTKAAITEVNSENVLHVCTSTECKESKLSSYLNVTRFNRNEAGEIDQLGSDYRFYADEFKCMVDKIKLIQGASITNMPNNVYSFCKLHKTLKGENYIAKLIEDFLTSDLPDITISQEKNLEKAFATLYKALKINNPNIKNFFLINKSSTTPGRTHHTILSSGKEKDKIIRDLDLSKIDEIKCWDLKKVGDDFETLTKPNKSLFDMVSNKPPKETTNKKYWTLKTKLYSPFDDPKHYEALKIAPNIYKANYGLNQELLEALNLKSVQPVYKSQGLNFSNTYVPAFYYPDWGKTVLDVKTYQEIRKNEFNTELGFLLYKISNFQYTTLETGNNFVYNGKPIYLTTGIRFLDKSLKCEVARDIKTNNLITNKSYFASFSEVYREDLEKSFWLTLLHSYLWEGQIGRNFVGLAPGVLETNFKYTVPACYVDEDGKIFDSKKQAELIEKKEDKLPGYDIDIFAPKNNIYKFRRVMTDLTARRAEIEINQVIKPPSLKIGDIYWNSLNYGLFDQNGKELTPSEPMLILFGDGKYSYKDRSGLSINIGNQSKCFRFGLLNRWQPENLEISPDNLIKSEEPYPYIYYIKPLLYTFNPSAEYDQEKFKADIIDFLKYYNKHFKGKNLKLYNNSWTGWKWNEINVLRQWPQYNNEFLYIKEFTELIGSTYKYIRMEIYNTPSPQKRSFMYLWCTVENWKIIDYGQNNLLRENYLKNTSSYLTYKVWDSMAQTENILKPDVKTSTQGNYTAHKSKFGFQTVTASADGRLKDVIGQAYEYINNEKIDFENCTYTHFNELYLKDGEDHCFSFGSQGSIIFYALINWKANAEKPTIELIINDRSILEDIKGDNITLINSSLLKNNNLPQVVNQQNFLYVHGNLMPIKTKMITNTGIINYNFSVENLKIEDETNSHYRVFFTGDGGDLIKTNITVIKKDIQDTIGKRDWNDLANLRLTLAEGRKNREMAAAERKESERKLNLNVRNQEADLHWENIHFQGSTALNVLGGIASTASGVFFNPAGAALGGLSQVMGIGQGIWAKTHELDNKRRNLDQQILANATQIEHQKNRLQTSHKYEELREKNRIYEISNTVITSIPNDADILESSQKLDTDGADIGFINRMPVGTLLEYLTEYHKNWGYDIFVNNFQLYARSLKGGDNQIYQFSRIDDISITNLQEKEIIKNAFINGVYLIDYKYELSHISLLELRKQHALKVAAAKAEADRAIKEAEERRLNEIKAIELAKEQAKEEFKDLSEFKKTCEKELTDYARKMTEATAKIEEYERRLNAFNIDEQTKFTGLNTQVTTLNSQLDTLKNEFKPLQELNKRIEAEKAELVRDNTAKTLEVNECKANIKEIREILDTTSQTNADLINKNQDFSNKNSQLVRENAQLKNQVEELKKPCVLPAEDLTELNEKIAKLEEINKELVKKKTKLDELRDEYKTKLFNMVKHMVGKGYIRFHEDRNKYYSIYGSDFKNVYTYHQIPYIDIGRSFTYKGKTVSYFTPPEFENLIRLPSRYAFNVDHSTAFTDYKGFAIYWKDGEAWAFIELNPERIKRLGRDLKKTTDAITAQQYSIANYIISNTFYIEEADQRAEEWFNLNY